MRTATIITAFVLACSPVAAPAQDSFSPRGAPVDERSPPLVRYRSAHLALQEWPARNPGSPVPMLSDPQAAALIRAGFDEAVLEHFPSGPTAIAELCQVSNKSLGVFIPKTEEEVYQRSGELAHALAFAMSCLNLTLTAANASLETAGPEWTKRIDPIRDGAAKTYLNAIGLTADPAWPRDDKMRLLDSADRNAAGFAAVMTVAQRRDVVALIDSSTLWAGSAARRHYMSIREAMSSTDCVGMCAYRESRRT